MLPITDHVIMQGTMRQIKEVAVISPRQTMIRTTRDITKIREIRHQNLRRQSVSGVGKPIIPINPANSTVSMLRILLAVKMQ